MIRCVICGHDVPLASQTINELEKENARLREALEKLASEENLPWTGIVVQEFASAAIGKE